MKMKYTGYMKTTINGCNVHNGETVEVDDEVIDNLNPNEWEEAKTKSKKSEVEKNGKDLESKGSNNEA